MPRESAIIRRAGGNRARTPGIEAGSAGDRASGGHLADIGAEVILEEVAEYGVAAGDGNSGSGTIRIACDTWLAGDVAQMSLSNLRARIDAPFSTLLLRKAHQITTLLFRQRRVEL